MVGISFPGSAEDGGETLLLPDASALRLRYGQSLVHLREQESPLQKEEIDGESIRAMVNAAIMAITLALTGLLLRHVSGHTPPDRPTASTVQEATD